MIQQNRLEGGVDLYNAKECVGFTKTGIFDYTQSVKSAQYHTHKHTPHTHTHTHRHIHNSHKPHTHTHTTHTHNRKTREMAPCQRRTGSQLFKCLLKIHQIYRLSKTDLDQYMTFHHINSDTYRTGLLYINIYYEQKNVAQYKKNWNK